MTEAPETAVEWPREIWAAERGEHDPTGDHVFSQHATVSRFDGDRERERDFHRYVDADIFDSQVRYHQAVLANMRTEIATQTATLTAAQERIDVLERELTEAKDVAREMRGWETVALSNGEAAKSWRDRASHADAEAERLREALSEIAYNGGSGREPNWEVACRVRQHVARAALATQEDREDG